MPQYLTQSEYSAQTWISDSWLADAEVRKPGVINNSLVMESARIDSNLVKRYLVPFALPAPVVVQRWLIQLVNVQIMLVVGVDQTDMMYTVVQGQYDTALKELDLAANGEAGHFELPQKATEPSSDGIVKGSPRSYSEQSPYVGWDVQGCIGRREDINRRGTTQ
jgi:phage gp36-like protein